MVEELLEDFLARAGGHGFFDIIARFVDVEPVAPEYGDGFGLVPEVRLVWDDDGHEPG